MEPLYNIYYAGEVLEGHNTAEVRARLGQLFKANAATLDKLFSGKPQLLKRDCDKATALKYKQAMEQAGARPRIAAAGEAAAAEAKAPQSAAERIAALAAAPDVGYDPKPAAPAEAPADADEPASGLSANPPQGELLRPEERPQVETVEVDTSALSAQGDYGRLEAEAAAPPPAPDTGHLSMEEAGAIIPNLDKGELPPSPDTSALDLSPQGTDFSDCAGPEPEAPDLDLSGIDLAPAGSEVLEEKYRRKETPPAPPTDHLSLDE